MLLTILHTILPTILLKLRCDNTMHYALLLILQKGDSGGSLQLRKIPNRMTADEPFQQGQIRIGWRERRRKGGWKGCRKRSSNFGRSGTLETQIRTGGSVSSSAASSSSRTGSRQQGVIGNSLRRSRRRNIQRRTSAQIAQNGVQIRGETVQHLSKYPNQKN